MMIFSLPIGYILDLLLGDPAWLPHPVVGFGKMIACGERWLNRGKYRMWKGAFLTLFLIVFAYLITYVILSQLSIFHFQFSTFNFVWKNGRNHASPNSGYPEAALAAILDCRFGGPHYYFGELFDKPYIGTNDRELTTDEMYRAVRINRSAEIIMVILVTTLFWFVMKE